MHDHPHSHDHAHDGSPEKTLALLNYMADHNRHHEEELHELAHQVPEDVGALLHAAVEDFRRGNEKLAQALSKLKGE